MQKAPAQRRDAPAPGRAAAPAGKNAAARRRKPTQGVDLEATLVSVKVLIGVGIGIVAVVLGIVVFLASRGKDDPEAVARRTVAEAKDLSTRAATSPNLAQQKPSFDEGQALLSQAEIALGSKGWATATEHADAAKGKFKIVINVEEGAADAQFREVEGSVQVQKGGQGSWTTARPKMALSDGDFVKTGGNGTAQILYADGQIQTIRPDTLFEFKRHVDPQTKMIKNQFKIIKGVSELQTTNSPAEIISPNNVKIEQEVESSSSFKVEADKATTVSIFEGKAAVVSPTGERRQIRDNQAVATSATGTIGATIALPNPPQLLLPNDGVSYSTDAADSVALKWSAVPGATAYQLQVSKGRFFAYPEIDVRDRRKTDATVRILGAGVYFWRVAAISPEGVAGEFSIPRRFRFTSGDIVIPPTISTSTSTGIAPPATAKPPVAAGPKLTVTPSTPFGSIWLLEGTTDPGAIVTVNGENAMVDAQGNWRASYQFPKVGLNTIVIKAILGNGETSKTLQRTYDE